MPAKSMCRWGRDDLLQGHEAHPVGQRDEALQQRRHLDPGHVRLAALAVGDHHGEVERQVGDVGEGMRRVDGERGQHRVDAVLEDAAERGPVALGQRRPVDEADALAIQGHGHVGGEAAGVALHQLADPGVDGAQLLRGRRAVR